MTDHNRYIFMHEDGDDEIIFRFRNVLAEGIIREFISFMRACSYHDDSIHSAMSEIVDEYFQCEERRRLGLPLQQDELA